MSVQVDTVTTRPIFTLTVEHKDTDEVFRRFVKSDGTRAATAGEKVLGVSRVRSTTSGDDLPLDVAGLVLIEAGAVIAADASIATDAEGRAVTAAGANVVAGKALAAAAAVGDIIPALIGLSG